MPERLEGEQLFCRSAFLLPVRLGRARCGPNFSGAGDLRQLIEVFGQLGQERLVIAIGTIAANPAAAKLLGGQ